MMVNKRSRKEETANPSTRGKRGRPAAKKAATKEDNESVSIVAFTQKNSS